MARATPPLARGFYLHDTAAVARGLLGKRLVRRTARGRRMSGVITETEAYGHRDDPASHAFNGITERNRAMFGQVGTAYVYFTYGMHHCFNVVARRPGAQAGAVLIRAVRPEDGADIMRKNRKGAGPGNLANGPAKLAQAMQITRSQYGADLTSEGSEVFITEGIGDVAGVGGRITASGRIGIRRATERLWNFRAEL